MLSLANYRLLKILAESRSDARAWLDPSGNFKPLPDSKNHGDIAGEITKEQYPKSMYFMFANGWQRITFYGKDLYTHNFLKLPNQMQIGKLIDFCLENDFDRIVHDNERQDKVLWHVDFDT